MNETLAIAARELRERSRVFLICAALAVLPFVAASLPMNRGHRLQMVPILGGFTAIAVGLGLAVVLGATVVVSDLAQRRATFYFSRPVSAASIWVGKTIAALLTAVGGLLIIGVPSGLVQAGRQWEWIPRLTVLGAVLLAVVALYLVSHVVATVLRSHSAVLGIDFVLLLAGIVALAFIARPLLFGGAFRTTGALLAVIAASVLLLFAVAPVWQLERGRTDLRRSHAALSRILWPGVAVILLAAAGFVAWFVSVTPSQLTRVFDTQQPASGDRVMVAGQSKNRGDYVAAFLVDQRSGEFERLGAMGWWGFRFSRDGSTAAWMAPAGFASFRNPRMNELHVRHLGGKGAGDGETATGMRFIAPSFVLSDDGSRLAVASSEGLIILDTRSRRLLASTKGVTSRPGLVMFFPDPGHLRVIDVGSSRDGAPSPMRIQELDVARKSWTATGQRMVSTPTRMLSISEDGGRMLVRGTKEVLDARTGGVIRTLDAEPAPHVRMATVMLADGGVAMLTQPAGVLNLRTYDRDGRVTHDVPLPGTARGFIAGETADGRLLVFTSSGAPGSTEGMGTLVVDLNRGTVERKIEGVRGPFPDWTPDARVMRYAAGQPVAVSNGQGGVVMVNPATGERRGL